MSGVPAAAKTVLTIISSGTASSAPVVPIPKPRKLSEIRIRSGFTSILPTIIGRDGIGSTACRPERSRAEALQPKCRETSSGAR